PPRPGRHLDPNADPRDLDGDPPSPHGERQGRTRRLPVAIGSRVAIDPDYLFSAVGAADLVDMVAVLKGRRGGWFGDGGMAPKSSLAIYSHVTAAQRNSPRPNRSEAVLVTDN